MKSLKVLSTLVFLGAVGSAEAKDFPNDTTEYEDRDLANVTCTNDGNGAFSFHMESYDEPMISILNSHYNMDGNNAVYVNTHEDEPDLYETQMADDTNIKISEQFKSMFNDFSGRFLMFFERDDDNKLKCSIEEWFPTINVLRRSYAVQVDAPTLNGPTQP